MYVELEVSEEAITALNFTPENFSQEMRTAAAVKWYEMGKISQSKAAEIAGISRSAFIDLLGRFKVSPFQESFEDLNEAIQ